MNTQLQQNALVELVPVGNSAVGEELVVDNLVVQAAALMGVATHAVVSIKDAAVLVTFDGSAPASSGAGVLYAVGEREVWHQNRLAAAKFIEAVGGSDAVVRVEPMCFDPQ
tara:strand:- start:92 stop:424 length:333 start_codon:yes stop_codon:yes gene_type:complete